jgi:hypothetical protein
MIIIIIPITQEYNNNNNNNSNNNNKTLRKSPLRRLGVNGRIILNWTVRKWCEDVATGGSG